MTVEGYRVRGRKASEKAKLRLTQPSSWKLEKQESSIAPADVWTNSDQDPVPLELQTWTGATFAFYWFSDLITVSGWSAASSIMTTGLSSTDAILITLCAGICNAIPTVLNGAVGSDLHIAFPIAIRASYGYWFSYFCVISRGILALFWFGVQSAYGGACVTPIITAIWPSYANLTNHLPNSAGISTQGMISYFIYWSVQFPALLIPTHKLQSIFWVKTLLVPPTALAMVIWISVKAGGAGTFFNAPPSVHGSTRAWLWLANLTSVTGGFSTLAVNIPDFSRFSKNSGAQIWQLPCIPFLKVIVGIFGIISASASKEIYGTTLWSPLTIIAKWQGTPGGRAAAFFAGLVWLVAQISVNVTANSISFANDITTLAPRYFNIRRGVIFASIIGGWALCPWIIIASASAFLSFMSAYAIFMAPMAGILFCDYWLVKQRKYDVPALYDPRGIYFYRYGTNWRALAVTVIVIIPLLPGLIWKVAPHVHISVGLQHLFSFNWLYGFVLSVTLYYFLNYFFPDQNTLIPKVVFGLPQVVEGMEVDVESDASIRDGGEKFLGIEKAREVGNTASI